MLVTQCERGLGMRRCGGECPFMYRELQVPAVKTTVGQLAPPDKNRTALAEYVGITQRAVQVWQDVITRAFASDG